MTRHIPHDRNVDQVAYWNGPAGTRWAERQETQDLVLAPVSAHLIAAAAVMPGEHVIDIGCGCGATSIEVAGKVGVHGSVLGIDVSEQMLARARQRAPKALPLTFSEADATIYPFAQGAADLLISRFGVMFFADPTASFTNLRTALKPGGRLAFACWREPKLNPFFMAPLAAVYKHVPRLPEVAPEDPGPFAFQREERVRRVLDEAGFADVGLASHTLSLDLARGQGLDAAVQSAIEIGPAQRAVQDQPPAVRAAAVAEIRTMLAARQKGDTVSLDAAIWIVTARVL